jgi:hypothetical protein
MQAVQFKPENQIVDGSLSCDDALLKERAELP